MHVCVLGAGIVGVTSAYRLREAGHRITLVEAMSHQSGFRFAHSKRIGKLELRNGTLTAVHPCPG